MKQKCLKKAGFVVTQKHAPSDSPSQMAEFEGVDFECFVAKNDMATCNEPDWDAFFQAILTKVQTNIKVHEAASAGDREIAESKGRGCQAAVNTASVICCRKIPGMLCDVASVKSPFSTYICNRNKTDQD